MNNCKIISAQSILDQASHGSIDDYQINMLASMINKLSDAADSADMLRDEIVRIQVANKCNNDDDEISGLCERSILDISRNISVLNEIDTLKNEINRMITARELIRVLFYAPSSPVSPDLAEKIRVWYDENEIAISALNRK